MECKGIFTHQYTPVHTEGGNMRRILKITGNIYMPMKEGETLEEAGDRFDELLDHSVEFASYNMAIVDDDGNEIETEEGVPVSTPSP